MRGLGRPAKGRLVADRRVWRSGAVASAVLAVAASLVVLPSSPAYAAGLAATASLTPAAQYLGDSAGTTLTFTVHNTGTTSGIGAVQISRPFTAWTVVGCPSAPTGWTVQRSLYYCRYVSAAGAGDDLAPGASSSAFRLRATTVGGTANRSGVWKVLVSPSNTFTPDRLAQASAAPPGLRQTVYAWQVTTAVVAHAPVGAGAPCPAANRTAHAGTTTTVVICGRNRTSSSATTAAPPSSLGGTLVQSSGAFAGGTVRNGTTAVVLGSWSGAQAAGTPSSALTVVPVVGSAPTVTSPRITLRNYTVAPDTAPTADPQTVSGTEDTPQTVDLSGSDPDGDPLTFTVTSGPSHGSLDTTTPAASCSGTSGRCTATVLYTPDPNANGPDTFSYQVSDGGLSSAPADVSISVAAVNDAPAVDAASFTIDDTAVNGASVGTVTSSDPDSGETYTYAITAGNTGSAFTIDPGTGEVTVADSSVVAAGSPYALTVQVTDDGSPPMSGSNTVTVTVNHVDQPPVLTLPSGPLAIEQGAATPVTGVSVTDPDAGTQDVRLDLSVAHGTLTVPTSVSGGVTTTQVTGNGTGSLSLTASQDAIDATLGDAAGLVYQSDASFTGTDTVHALASDLGHTGSGGPLTDSGTVDLDVAPVNHAPTDIGLSNATVAENQSAGTMVGTLSATDQDSGDTATYALVTGTGDTGNAAFSIVGNTLQTATILDYEQQSTYWIRVEVTDSGGLTVDKQFTVTVTNVNDPPVATADSYTGAVGNTTFVVGTTASGPAATGTGGTLVANDTDEDSGDTLTAVTETVTTSLGGSATIGSDGSFTYTPPVGAKNTTDSFTYHVTDGTATTAGTATVAIGDLVWYVDNSQSTNGNGTSGSPYNTLSPLNGTNDSDGPGDVIFLYHGNGSYGGGITLENGQRLIGQAFGLTVDGNVLVTAGGSNPVITNANGNGITLADNDTIEAVSVSSPAGYGVAGTGVNNLTYGASTQIAGATGGAVSLTGGGSGLIEIDASITNSTGHAVTISNRTGGTVSLTGDVKDTGTGILLTSNTGATIEFSGVITVNTGTAAAFTATGGGVVAAPGSGNSLATTTGTALTVTDTTIGSDGLVFDSISSNGAVDGISLSNTGSSGGLTVTGTGTGGTGGTIKSSTGPGVALDRTHDVTLTDMVITGGADDGVRGSTVDGFTLAASTVSDNGDAVNERGLDFGDRSAGVTGLIGTAAITDSVLSGNYDDDAMVRDGTGSLSLTVSGSTFSNSNGTNRGNDGLLVLADDSSNVTATVSGSTFTENRGDHFQFTSNTTATGTNVVSFSGNTLTGDRGSTFGGTVLGGGITVNPGGSGTTTVTVSGNTITGAVDSAIKLNPSFTTNGILNATINNNTVGDPTVTDSGSAQANGIFVWTTGAGTTNALVTGNTVQQYANCCGISLLAGEGSSHQNTTVRGNTLRLPDPVNALNGIRLQAGTLNTDSVVLCADVGGSGSAANTAAGSGAPGQTDIRARIAGAAANTVQLPGYTGGSTDTTAVAAYLTSRNLGATATASDSVGGPFQSVAGCTLPPS